MSTVFISLFSWIFGQWTAARAHRSEINKTWQRLEVETSNRQRYISRITSRFPSPLYKVIRGAVYGFEPSANVNPSWILHYSPIFPEYENRSLSSLVWELGSISQAGDKPKINNIEAAVYQVESCFDDLQYSEVAHPGRKEPDEYYSLPSAEVDKCQTAIKGLDTIDELTVSTVR